MRCLVVVIPCVIFVREEQINRTIFIGMNKLRRRNLFRCDNLFAVFPFVKLFSTHTPLIARLREAEGIKRSSVHSYAHEMLESIYRIFDDVGFRSGDSFPR